MPMTSHSQPSLIMEWSEWIGNNLDQVIIKNGSLKKEKYVFFTLQKLKYLTKVNVDILWSERSFY